MTLIVDIGTLFGVSVLPPVVGIDVSTGIVGVGPSMVQVCMQSTYVNQYTAATAPSADLRTCVRACVDQFH